MFKLYFKPFWGEPPDADQFYALFGRCVVLWGRLDSTIEYLLFELMLFPSADLIRPRKLPTAFGEKIKLLEKGFRVLPELTSKRDAALQFTKEAARLAALRHSLVHAVIGYERRNKQYTGIRSKHDPSGSFYKVYRIERADLEKLRDDTVALTQSLNILIIFTWTQSFQPSEKEEAQKVPSASDIEKEGIVK